MATQKVSATLETSVIDEIKQLVGPRKVSAFLNDAAREKLQRTRILSYLDGLDEQFGEPDERSRRTAEKRLAAVFGS